MRLEDAPRACLSHADDFTANAAEIARGGVWVEWDGRGWP